MKSGINGRTAFTTTLRQEELSWCAPILCHQKRYANPKNSKNRDVKIIYQAILVGNMFTRDSRKVLDIIKELALGNDAETRIKGLKCGRKAMQLHYALI